MSQSVITAGKVLGLFALVGGLVTVVTLGCTNTVPDSNYQQKFEVQMKAQQRAREEQAKSQP